MKVNGSRYSNPVQFIKIAIDLYNDCIVQLVNDYKQYNNTKSKFTNIGFAIMWYSSKEYHQSSANLYEIDYIQEIDSANRAMMQLQGYVTITGQNGTHHYTTLWWDTTQKEDGFFNFSCEAHMHMCDNLRCPCVCIELLFKCIKERYKEEILDYLPLPIRTKIITGDIINDLYFPAFLVNNGVKVFKRGREKEKNVRSHILMVNTPSLYTIKNTPITSPRVEQPRKYRQPIQNGPRYRSNGEPVGGNTSSPNRTQRSREGRRFANDHTRCVRSTQLSTTTRVTLGAAIEEMTSGQNLSNGTPLRPQNQSTHDSLADFTQELIRAPLINTQPEPSTSSSTPTSGSDNVLQSGHQFPNNTPTSNFEDVFSGQEDSSVSIPATTTTPVNNDKNSDDNEIVLMESPITSDNDNTVLSEQLILTQPSCTGNESDDDNKSNNVIITQQTQDTVYDSDVGVNVESTIKFIHAKDVFMEDDEEYDFDDLEMEPSVALTCAVEIETKKDGTCSSTKDSDSCSVVDAIESTPVKGDSSSHQVLLVDKNNEFSDFKRDDAANGPLYLTNITAATGVSQLRTPASQQNDLHNDIPQDKKVAVVTPPDTSSAIVSKAGPLVTERKVAIDDDDTFTTRNADWYPISDDEAKIVHKAIDGSGNSAKIVATYKNDTVTKASLQTLKPNTWLNDEIINFFFKLLEKQDKESFENDATHPRTLFCKSFLITKMLNEGNVERE